MSATALTIIPMGLAGPALRHNRPTTITDLPNELLLDITCYLPLRSLKALRNVDQRWRAIVSAASEVGLPETTKKLLAAWIATVALHHDLSKFNNTQEATLNGVRSGSDEVAATLSDMERDRYVFIVGRYAASYQTVSQEEPGLSDEFLTWLYEWPLHVTLPASSLLLPSPAIPVGRMSEPSSAGALSPFSVVNSVVHSAAYCTSQTRNWNDEGVFSRPSYYYQEGIILLIAVDETDVLLPRIQLTKKEVTRPSVKLVKNGKTFTRPAHSREIIQCSTFPGGAPPFSTTGLDWARFLPISTAPKVPSADQQGHSDLYPFEMDADGKTPVPLYVLSGSGLGEELTGSVCMLGANAELTVLASSWAEYLLVVAKAARDDVARKIKNRRAARVVRFVEPKTTKPGNRQSEVVHNPTRVQVAPRPPTLGTPNVAAPKTPPTVVTSGPYVPPLGERLLAIVAWTYLAYLTFTIVDESLSILD